MLFLPWTTLLSRRRTATIAATTAPRSGTCLVTVICRAPASICAWTSRLRVTWRSKCRHPTAPTVEGCHAEAHRAGGHFALIRLTPNLDMAGVGVKRRGTGHFIADVVSALYAEQLLCRTIFPHSGTQFFPWLHGADALPETSRFVASCLQTGNRLQTSPDLH